MSLQKPLVAELVLDELAAELDRVAGEEHVAQDEEEKVVLRAALHHSRQSPDVLLSQRVELQRQELGGLCAREEVAELHHGGVARGDDRADLDPLHVAVAEVRLATLDVVAEHADAERQTNRQTTKSCTCSSRRSWRRAGRSDAPRWTADCSPSPGRSPRDSADTTRPC